MVLDAGVAVGTGDYNPDIAFDGNRCLVTWSEEFNGVTGRFVNASCQPEGQTIEIAVTQGISTTPIVEFGAQNYLVVWPDFCPLGTDLDIFGQVVAASGQLIGERMQIADGIESQNYPAVAFDGNTFLVVWVEDLNTVYGRYVSTSGIPVGNKFPVSESTSFERQHPSLAAGTNSFLVAWNEYHTDFDVYGNLDVPVGIEETQLERPVRGLIMFANQLEQYLEGDNRLYDILGRHVQNMQITPRIYFLEFNGNNLLKIVVIR